ncbi:hypothetical protein [Sphingobium sp. Z007]|uniref:hypothetical protein n=1 Tax=Sphingobium sp. Z007 TaxID=627495 RepID=UPI000B4980CD|nr:hypothetical protein [Sphingobium sp. Z007]
MTALSPRQAIKVKAALSLIAIHGHNPRTVQQQAQASIANGNPAAKAYKAALDGFANRVPALRPTLEMAVDLIHHSDEATVAIYDRALSVFNDTGNSSHLDALAPMILEDAKALAIQNGDASEADTANWDIGDALGYSDDAFALTPDVPDATTHAPGEARQTQFQFAGSPGPGPVPSAPVAAPAPVGLWTEAGYSAGSIWSSNECRSDIAQPAPYDPTKPYHDATGYRAALTGEDARRWHGTPMGGISYIQDETGIRAAPTGEQARREAGIPLGPIDFS